MHYILKCHHLTNLSLRKKRVCDKINVVNLLHRNKEEVITLPNKYIAFVYQDVYKEDFDCSEFLCRLKMQKLIYLILQMGINIGEYNFSWYKHGPYSQQLQNDMLSMAPVVSAKGNLQYSRRAKDAVRQVSESLQKPKGSPYGSADWAECIASIHYLKKYIMPQDANEEDTIYELEKQKQHLNDHNSNEIAYEKASMI